MRRKRLIVAAAALVVLGGAVAAVALTLGNGPPSVTAAEVTREDLALTVIATGRVESDRRADIVPPTAGTLESVEVSDGQSVKAGQVIARLDTEQLEAQLRQAESAEDAARAQLEAVRSSGPTEQQVSAADDAVANARQSYMQTREAAGQLDELIGRLPSEASDALDTSAITDTLVGQSYGQYQSALAQREALNVDTSASEAAAQVQVDQAAEQVRAAERLIEDATMRSPIDGVVIFNAVSASGISGGASAGLGGGGAIDVSGAKPAVGSAVNPQQPPFTVVQLDSLRFSAEVDEADIARIEAEMAATVRLDAFDQRSFETSVTRILPKAQATATGGTVFPVLMPLVETGADILVGMQGDATISIRTVPDAVTIPVEALFEEDGERFAYVVSGGELERRPIEIGVLTETRIQVLEGLEPGDRVVTSGPEQMRDGMRVTVEG